MKMTQKYLSVLLSVLLVFGLVPFGAYADEGDAAADWGEARYVWADDYSSCTATLECIATPDESISEVCQSIEELENVAPDCENDGYITYRAIFTNEAFEAQDIKVTVDALDHDWGEWETVKEPSEHEKGLKRRVCKRNETHIDEEEIPTISVDYKIRVNGERLGTDNKEITCGQGTASFDSKTNTLTLKNAEISTAYSYSENEKALIYSEIEDLTIAVDGDSALVGGNDIPSGIVTADGCSLKFTGKGALSVSRVSTGVYAAGGSVLFDGADVSVEAQSSTGLWAEKDITFNNSKAKITTNAQFANAVISNTAGTITSTESDVEISSRRAAIRFGSGDEDNSNHKFVLNSGTFKINSTSDYGILVWAYRDPVSYATQKNGRVELNGGTLDVTSASGAIDSIDTYCAENMNFAEGVSLYDSGHMVITDEAISFKLWVNGEQFTTEKSEIACGGGKAVYDAKSRTLTLDNAVISTPYEYGEYESAMIYSALKELTVKINGKAEISGGAGYAVLTDKDCSLSFNGGELTVSGTSGGIRVGESNDEGASLSINDSKIDITAQSSTGLWVSKDINVSQSDLKVVTNGRFAGAIVSNVDGAFTITGSNVEAESRRAAIHFGGGDDDYSEHKLVMNSGTLTLTSSSDYGVFVYHYRDPYTGETAPIGSIRISSGIVNINSMYGGTNLADEDVTLGDDLVVSVGESFSSPNHVFIKPKSMIMPEPVNEKPATCEENGVKAHFADGDLKFEDAEGKKPVTDAQLVIPAAGHKWGEPTYEWDDEAKTCTAAVVCETDDSHIVTETVDYVTINLGGPYCEEEGTLLDIANFKGEMFKNQVTRSHAVPAAGHKWGEVEYQWSDDYSSCTATVVCLNDSSHIITETTANIEVHETETEREYSAVFENELLGSAKVVINIEPQPTQPEPTESVPVTEPASTEPAVTEPATQAPSEKPTTPVKKTVKKKNTLTVKKSKTKTVKANKLSKKKLSVKVLTITKAQGTLKVTKVKSGTSKKLYSKITVSKTGKITIKKGKYKKGTYKIKLKITAKGNSKYSAKTVTKIVKVKVI